MEEAPAVLLEVFRMKALEKFAQMASRVQIVHFNELPIPFAAVAADLETGKKVVLTNGSLASTMRASMAIQAFLNHGQLEDAF